MSANLSSWLALAVAVITVPLTYLAYRVQRGKTEIQYVVTANSRLLSRRLIGAQLKVLMGDEEIPDPSFTQVRLVNSGDRAIRVEDFNTELSLRLSVDQVRSSVVSAARPHDVAPTVVFDKQTVYIKPFLFNPGDMVEIQIISSGIGKSITLQGRLTATAFVQRQGLPYPPGSGPEGEMLGFDKFMWFVFSPIVLGGLAGLFIAPLLANLSIEKWARISILLIVIAGALAIYWARTRFLVRRRRMWRA